MGLLISKEEKHVLIEDKLGDIRARLEHTPRKSLKRLARDGGVKV
jgi:hypothetical protein